MTKKDDTKRKAEIG